MSDKTEKIIIDETDKNIQIIGFIDLKCNKYWNKSVLGKKYKINICNTEVIIHFPALPSVWKENSEVENILDYPLLSPMISKKYKLGSEDIIYGFPISYPSGCSIVNKVIISFEITKEELDEDKEFIYKIIEDYMKKFYKLLYIVNQSIIPNTDSNKIANDIELINNCNGTRINNTHPICFNVYMKKEEDAITKSQFEDILKILEKDLLIPFEYEFLINGIISYEKHNYRNCILDLATACEIAVTNKIDVILNKIGIEKILQDYQGLEKRFKLLGKLNYDISFVDINKITNIRNKAIHSGIDVKVEEAFEAIKNTRIVLDNLSKFY